MALAEAEYEGWLSQLLTHPVRGLENYAELLATLTSATDAIKMYCEVVPFGTSTPRLRHDVDAASAVSV